MSTETLTREIRELVASTTKRDVTDLGDDDDIVRTLGVDSLGGLRVLALFEKRFDVRIPDGELANLRTIRALVEAVERWKEEDAP